jgi:hypothetical protein
MEPIMSEEYQTDPQHVGAAFATLDVDTMVEGHCNRCNAPIGQVVASMKDGICCDPCVEKWEHNRKIEACREFWKTFCPKLYADTDTQHPDFLRIWPLVASHDDPRQNLILCGSTGACKTRAMMHRLKLCLLKGNSVGVLWADALDDAIESRKMSKLREACLEPAVLGIDDFLTSGSAFENVTKFLKGLIDIRLRDGKTTIITTQLKARDVEGDSDKFGNRTKADQERVNAIIRRLRGEFKTVDFDAGLGCGRF